jgi:DNA polymerase-3 subunit delta'
MTDITLEQPKCISFIDKSFHENRLVHGFLLFGGDEVSRKAVSYYIAKKILGEDDLTNRLIETNQHANVIVIAPDGKNIKKEQILLLKQEISMKSVEEKAKIFIITDAHLMSISATNSLLKFLEEPADDVYIILTAPAKDNLLQTITSRTLNLKLEDQPRTYEFSSQVIDMLTLLENNTLPPQIIVAQNQAFFKDNIREFLDVFGIYYKNVFDVLINEKDSFLFDAQLMKKTLNSNDLSKVARKIRAIEDAKTNLRNNMNVSLCLDQLLLLF